MKKVIVVVLSMLMIFSMVGCGKKETTTEEQTETKPNEAISMETEKEEEPEIKTGAWEIVNLPYEEASQDVKNVFNKAMESVEETLVPTTFLGSQVVSGMNYAFLATDNVNAERYIYIYQNAKGEIEKIEISKPNEKLEILPNDQIDEVLGTAENTDSETTANNENSTEETQTQPEVVNHNENASNETQTANNSTTNNSTTNNSTTNNSTTNNSGNSSNSEQAPAYKNAEEALIGIYGSKEEAYKALNPDGKMDIEIKENEIIYTYVYPEELDNEIIAIRKAEIIEAMNGPVTANHRSFIEDLEAKGNISGVKIIAKYFEKTGKEIVTIQFDKNGIIK